MLDGFDIAGFRFDTAPLKDLYAGRFIARTAPIDLLSRSDPLSDTEAGLVIRLLKTGCSPNATDADGNTVLMCACRAGSEAVVRHLLAHCADVDPHHANDRGQNAFTLARDKPDLLTLLNQARIGS